MHYFEGYAAGAADARWWKYTASEAEAQLVANRTAEVALAGRESRAQKDVEWLKTHLVSAEEQRSHMASRMASLSEHYEGLAYNHSDVAMKATAQVIAHRRKMRDEEAKMQLLESCSNSLVDEFHEVYNEAFRLAHLMAEAREENSQLSARLAATEVTLLQTETRERNLELKLKSSEEANDVLREQIWKADNRAGQAEAEMKLMSEQNLALKRKNKAAESKCLRFTTVEEANKHLRLKLEKFKDQEKLFESVCKHNDKLKRRYTSSKSAVAVAQSMETEIQLLRSELVEVTTVLEQVGNLYEPTSYGGHGREHICGMNSHHQHARLKLSTTLQPSESDSNLRLTDIASIHSELRANASSMRSTTPLPRARSSRTSSPQHCARNRYSTDMDASLAEVVQNVSRALDRGIR